MKNWEKYEKEIQDLRTITFGMKEDGRIFPCHAIERRG